MTAYIIEIPNWNPTPLNKLIGNWRKTSKLKAADRAMIWAALQEEGKFKIPYKQIKRSVEMTITLGKGERACDVDAYWKSVLDGLVHGYALWNDSSKWCEILPIKFERAEKKHTRIVLRDL